MLATWNRIPGLLVLTSSGPPRTLSYSLVLTQVVGRSKCFFSFSATYLRLGGEKRRGGQSKTCILPYSTTSPSSRLNLLPLIFFYRQKKLKINNIQKCTTYRYKFAFLFSFSRRWKAQNWFIYTEILITGVFSRPAIFLFRMVDRLNDVAWSILKVSLLTLDKGLNALRIGDLQVWQFDTRVTILLCSCIFLGVCRHLVFGRFHEWHDWMTFQKF